VSALLQDLKYGLRIFAKSPGFTAVAVITLALGIGASTAVFSLVNAILLKPLPYPHAERIVMPWRLAPPQLNLGYDEIPWGLPDFRRMLTDVKAFEHLGAFKSDSFILTGRGDPVKLDGLRASSEFFPALGVEPVLGRAFTAAEDQPGHEHEVILSQGLWRDRFGGDPGILGRALGLNGESYTVIGVMPAGFAFPRKEEMPGSFDFPREAAIWVPLALPAAKVHRDDPDEVAAIARLRPSATLEEAQAEMNVFTRRMEEEVPLGKGWFDSSVTPLARQVAGDTRRPLLLILAAIGVVLLIACANVANLLLSRSLARKKEFTLRAALGAGHGRLVRQLLTESILLAFFSGLAGLLLAQVGVYFVKTFGPSNIPRLREVALDFRVFAFAGTLASGILFGLAPALAAAGDGTGIRIPGKFLGNYTAGPFAEYTIVSPGYFSSVGTPILRGRGFSDSDTRDGMQVTIISLAMAKKFWPGEDPIGKEVGPGSKRFPVATIIGIAADVKHLSLREDAGPEMYVLYNQKIWPSLLTMQLAVRARADPASVISGARDAVRSVDPDLPIAKVAPLTLLVENSMTQSRFSMLLLGAFGVLAVILASVGIYGVISYSVGQRTREIGLRMALGAQRRSVLGLVLGQGARLAGLGIAIGIAAALALTRLMASLLFGIAPRDPLTFFAVPLLLMAVALAACYIPARRAMRVDPMVALRYE
jgi:ABC-type antimicrobial peptide transport system permease subunit